MTLSLKQLRLAAGRQPVDIDLPSASTTVLLGRNRAGKTPLLRLLAGLECTASAAISLREERLPELNSGARGVGFVFQAFVNYPHWSVAQNIASPLVAAGINSAERSQRVERIAATLGIAEHLDKKPDELSGGQQQRLAIGRALAADPKILLLDEPFVNLDLRLREQLTLEIGALLRERDATLVFATTEVADAFAIADHLVLLADNAVLQSGPPLALYRQPASLAAADLMSEPGVNWRADADDSATVVRPEHLHLAPPSGAHSAFGLHIDAVETTGAHTLVQGTLRGVGDNSNRWVAKLPGVVEITGDAIELFADARDLLRLPLEGASAPAVA
ncbi:MAG: ABC transporter ATP-binding protein [Pseudomonadota bacterium]